MKTQSASLFTKLMLTLGIFGISALTTYGAITNGELLKSTPYQNRSATADAMLSKLTDGKGWAILDGVVAKVKVKAIEKGGSPLNVSTYNAYIDSRLAAIDNLDNQIRKELWSDDYAFLFQYIYPRVLELKQEENKASTIINRITGILDDDSTNSNNGSSNNNSVNSSSNSYLNNTAGVTSSTANQSASDNGSFYISALNQGDKIMLSYKIGKQYGYKGCILTTGSSEDFFKVSSSGYSSTSGQQSGLGNSLKDGTFAGSIYMGNKDLDKLYVNLYCQKNDLVNNKLDMGNMEKVIAPATLSSIIRSPITVISTSKIPGDTSSTTRKILTADEKATVKWYITAVISGAGTEKEKAQAIYDAMKTYNLDAQHVADAIGYSVAEVNAYLEKRNASAEVRCPGSTKTTTISSPNGSNSCSFTWPATAAGKKFSTTSINNSNGVLSATCSASGEWIDVVSTCPDKTTAVTCPGSTEPALVQSSNSSNSCSFTWPATAAGKSYSGRGTNNGTLSATCSAAGEWSNVNAVCPNK